MLANTLPYLPEGVHLAVVDPGVGGERRAIALRSGDGRLFVGPDNGLLVPAAEKLGGIEAAHEITNREYALEPVSATFHGRDVFSPAAAHLAQGLAIEELGPGGRGRLAGEARGAQARHQRPADPRLLPLRRPLREHAAQPHARARRSGSASSRARRSSSSSPSERYYAIAARTFADARGGEIILYEDAYENIAIAISGGSAAETFSGAARRRRPDPGRGADAREPGPQVRAVHDEPGRAPAVGVAAVPPADAPAVRPHRAGRGTRCAARRRSRPLEAALDSIDIAAEAASSTSAPGRARAAFMLARRYPEAEVVGADLAPAMLAEARRLTPPELADRVRFEEADAERLPYPDASFDLVSLANMIPFFDELARVTAPGGAVVFSFSGGAETPIYVPPEVLRRELAKRGFTEFADFAAGTGTALMARKARPSVIFCRHEDVRDTVSPVRTSFFRAVRAVSRGLGTSPRDEDRWLRHLAPRDRDRGRLPPPALLHGQRLAARRLERRLLERRSWSRRRSPGRTTARAFDLVDIPRYTVNSLIVVAFAVPLTVLTASWAAFAMTRLPRRWAGALVVVSLVALMVPLTALLVPRFVIFRHLGLDRHVRAADRSRADGNVAVLRPALLLELQAAARPSSSRLLGSRDWRRLRSGGESRCRSFGR